MTDNPYAYDKTRQPNLREAIRLLACSYASLQCSAAHEILGAHEEVHRTLVAASQAADEAAEVLRRLSGRTA